MGKEIWDFPKNEKVEVIFISETMAIGLRIKNNIQGNLILEKLVDGWISCLWASRKSGLTEEIRIFEGQGGKYKALHKCSPSFALNHLHFTSVIY